MEEVITCEKISEDKYFSFYLPPNTVVKADTKLTKVRVVFNASKLLHKLGNLLKCHLIYGTYSPTRFNAHHT